MTDNDRLVDEIEKYLDEKLAEKGLPVGGWEEEKENDKDRKADK